MTIIFVCGRTCSGKTTIANNLAYGLEAPHLEVGDIVRDLKRTSERKNLIDNPDFDVMIIEALKLRIANMPGEYTSVVISGVRQKSIIDAFPGAQIVWVSTPPKQRQEWFEKRQAYRPESNLSLKELDKADDKLGLMDIFDMFTKQERN
jgi:adenylate kinase family enzyme